jgi:hypothetical protein
MPYWDGECEVSPDVANISEALASAPFQDGYFLPTGTHLHWALPSALTRAVTSDDNGRMSFPAVPNRWLVTRSKPGSDRRATIDRQWIVESDYIFPEDTRTMHAAVAVPFPIRGRRRPFAFVGRQVPFDAKWREPAADEHLAGMGYRLTAVGYEPSQSATGGAPGYAEPTFAAFFGNCHSVFGCHDPDPPQGSEGARYDLVGWYSDQGADPLRARAFSDVLARIIAEAPLEDRTEHEAKALLDAYGWQVDGRLPGSLEATVCYARIEIASDAVVCAALPDRPVHVAIGNTATEALSAHLAARLAKSLDTTPELLEEQLEALHLATRLEAVSVRDLGPKFKEARHDRGFSRMTGGRSWTVRRTSPSAPVVDAGDIRLDAALPDEIAARLDALNRQERAYDRAARELETLQRQLFADWYKYMLCSYPPPDNAHDYLPADEVRYFIEQNDLPSIHTKTHACAALLRQCDEHKRALEAVLSGQPGQAEAAYELTQRPGPRYYRPHEPVVLLVDKDLRPTERHAPGTVVVCATLTIDGREALDFIPRVHRALDKIESSVGSAERSSRGFRSWDEQPFHPYALDWSVEVSPIERGNNLHPRLRRYSDDFIESNYRLDDDGVELTLVPGAGKVQPAASIYTGTSILTPHARFQLLDRIHAYLEKRLLKAYFEAFKVPAAARVDDYIVRHRSAVIAWYRDSALKDPVLDAILAVLSLEDDDGFHGLGQSLNGFNDALLMRRQTFQLPIDEPLGFDDGRAFSQRVQKAVAGYFGSAPQPLDDFHPIRSGQLQVLALRLVDTFGRTQRLSPAGGYVTRTEVFKRAGHPHVIALSPRLVQSARLNFRWLSADSGERDVQEMTSHRATSPICGWLLPNHLDQTLMVYGTHGGALGSLSERGTWEPAPGSASHTRMEDLRGPLGAVVQHLGAAGQDALSAFFAAMNAALETIEPKGDREHDARALLVGRPIAVVRATLSLELRGVPARNQGWPAFERDLRRAERDDGQSTDAMREIDGITSVRFPVLLGDSAQASDGLVGFWSDSEGYAEFKTGKDCRLALCPNGPAALVTMLIDPRAPIHARSGVLPTKAIDLPSEQYARALQSIEITFLSAPILSPVGPDATTPATLELSLPPEAGSAWSWVSEHARELELVPANARATWGKPVEILEGWLKLVNAPEGASSPAPETDE